MLRPPSHSCLVYACSVCGRRPRSARVGFRALAARDLGSDRLLLGPDPPRGKPEADRCAFGLTECAGRRGRLQGAPGRYVIPLTF